MIFTLMTLTLLQDDLVTVLALFIIVDGILTVINIAILGLVVKLYSEFYKVRRLTPRDNLSKVQE